MSFAFDAQQGLAIVKVEIAGPTGNAILQFASTLVGWPCLSVFTKARQTASRSWPQQKVRRMNYMLRGGLI